MESRIYLVGFMGVGKSTIGKKLARMLHYRFVDLDKMFERRYKLNIDLFFNKYNEPLFRELESKLLTETFELENTVISTGGGTPCHHEGIDAMNRHGLTVYLKMGTAALASRLKTAKKRRPLLLDKNEEELERFIVEKLNNRKSCYEKAQIHVEALNLKTWELIKIITGE